MKKYHLLTVVMPDGIMYNAVTARSIGDVMIELVPSGIVIQHTEKVTKAQYNKLKELLDSV